MTEQRRYRASKKQHPVLDELDASVRHTAAQATWSVWETVVSYVNANPDDQLDAQRRFLEMVGRGLHWIGGTLNDAAHSDDVKEQGTDVLAALWSRALILNYRSGLELALRWLADPEGNKDAGIKAVEFLSAHGDGFSVDRTPLGQRAANNELRLLARQTKELSSLVAGICKFILDQIDQHDLAGVSLRDAIPIALCDRPGCGKFRLIKRGRKYERVFCSPSCKAKFHRENRPDENAGKRTNKQKQK